MEKIYEQKLDLYYAATIAYMVTLIAYAAVKGTLSGDTFELIWNDPIVYLLALIAVISLVALAVAVILDKKVIIRDDVLVFATRFKTRNIKPEQIEWVSFMSGSRGKIRQGEAERAARIKLKHRRRRLWLRPSMFDQRQEMMTDLRQWILRNNVLLKKRDKRRRLGKGE